MATHRVFVALSSDSRVQAWLKPRKGLGLAARAGMAVARGVALADVAGHHPVAGKTNAFIFSVLGGAVSKPRWLLTWLLAAAITLGGWFAFENTGARRLRAHRDGQPRPLVAASRPRRENRRHRNALRCSAPPHQYGFRRRCFATKRTRWGSTSDPIMLAVNGHLPLAALRDLADDPKFTGTVIIGCDSRGMDRKVWEMQAKQIQHYHHDWSPSREVHRRLLTRVQEHAIAARPDFAFVTLIKRISMGQVRRKEYVTFERDRAGAPIT